MNLLLLNELVFIKKKLDNVAIFILVNNFEGETEVPTLSFPLRIHSSCLSCVANQYS